MNRTNEHLLIDGESIVNYLHPEKQISEYTNVSLFLPRIVFVEYTNLS